MSSSSRTKSTDHLAELYSKAASKILKESLHLDKGESITIETWNNGQAFAQKLVMEARKIGAMPLVVFEDTDAFVQGAKAMDKEYGGKMGKHEYAMLSGSDAYVFIPGPPLSAYYSRISNEERNASTEYNSSWFKAAREAKLRGVRLTFGWVGKEMAKALGEAPDKIVEQQLKAVVDADFSSIGNAGKKIAQYLQDGATCVVTSANGSKLEFRLQGDADVEEGIMDKAAVADGSLMTFMPTGRVSKEVDSSVVSGRVKGFSAATPFGMIKDGTFEFESGKITKWESKSSAKALEKAVQNIDEDSRHLTLFSIGLNPAAKMGYGIDRFAKGVVSLNVTTKLGAILPRASVSVNGKEIVRAGKLV